MSASPCAAELSYPARDFRDLSDRKLSAQAEAAMGLQPERWRHAESEHFIYHFTDDKQAETILFHAETYYAWVRQMFGISGPDQPPKAQIFIFDDERVWDEFRHRGSLERLTGAEAFTDGRELYIHRIQFWLEPQRVLAHELTHVVLFRLLGARVPLYLNEGCAQVMGFKAVAMKFDGNEYAVHAIGRLSEAQYRPLDDLSTMTLYPKGLEETSAFYLESELFVRFLMERYGTGRFYAFLRASVDSRTLGYALHQVYETDVETLEKDFRGYALEKKS